MKLFFTTLALLLTLTMGTAQGNLQFNQVVLWESSFNLTNTFGAQYSPTQTVVVPAGKIWKIESASMGFNYTLSAVNHKEDTPDGTLFLNDKILYSSTTTSDRPFSFFPVWLPEGTYSINMRLNNISYGASYSNHVCKAMISIMEFNVVP